MAGQKMLIVVGGPTASGKTSLAIQLANYFKTEILSADSRQFYKEMSIGTAKPTSHELSQAKHHFIGHISIQDEYSAGKFETEAMALIIKLFETKDHIILAGGSGLFLKAVTEGLDPFPEIKPGVREALNEAYEKNGIQYLQQELKQKDPVYFQQVDRENPRRLIRALEVLHSTGKTMDFYQKGSQKSRPFQMVYLQPHWTREKLYERIDQRVELMFQEGLEKEVKSLHLHKELSSLQTVGYQELFSYLEGTSDLDTAKKMIKQNSRRYAKRQLTWARQRGQWVLLKKDFDESALQFINFVDAGWLWKIEHLKHPRNPLIAEEKVSRISFTKDAQIAEVIIAKQPKIMYAYWSVDVAIDEKIQQFLLDQVEMKADQLTLLIWSLPEDAGLLESRWEVNSNNSYFPFEVWVEKKKELTLYRLSKK